MVLIGTNCVHDDMLFLLRLQPTIATRMRMGARCQLRLGVYPVPYSAAVASAFDRTKSHLKVTAESASHLSPVGEKSSG